MTDLEQCRHDALDCNQFTWWPIGQQKQKTGNQSVM
jgi:hypothetical protein